MTNTALLLIDIQNDYFPSFEGSKMALPHMDAASGRAASLLATARQTGVRVIHVKHVMAPDAARFFLPGTAGGEIHDSVAPKAAETVVEKARPNSFAGTNLEALLREAQIEHLVICGAMSQMCVDATVRAGVDLGFEVSVAHDACAAANVAHNGVNVSSELVHAAIMAPLAASYADVRLASEIFPEV
ncbi:cysteine hydrolase family protein [Leisingera sp.]|uniref:cysteine hydrolase family protein n=1 Tax=Leisingera sp. TaxID=1879318 RepID=UPI002B26C170|nr:cysteine hydrolase family protein [Leisingera sp.]